MLLFYFQNKSTLAMLCSIKLMCTLFVKYFGANILFLYECHPFLWYRFSYFRNCAESQIIDNKCSYFITFCHFPFHAGSGIRHPWGSLTQGRKCFLQDGSQYWSSKCAILKGMHIFFLLFPNFPNLSCRRSLLSDPSIMIHFLNKKVGGWNIFLKKKSNL